jgi:hypothetical protein
MKPHLFPSELKLIKTNKQQQGIKLTKEQIEEKEKEKRRIQLKKL